MTLKHLRDQTNGKPHSARNWNGIATDPRPVMVLARKNKTIITPTRRANLMETTANYNTGHIVLAVLGGALAGAATALLLAPKTGRDTRHQLDGYLDTAKEKVALVPEAFRSAGAAAMDTMSQ
jgi:hypothetical protein